MGQRLVINIKCEEKNLACGYYHWSGYTSSSQRITNEVIDEYNSIMADELYYHTAPLNNYMKAVLMLQSSGAGIQEEEMGRIADDDTFEKDALEVGHNRNDGLIYVTPDEIESTIGWAEALVELDIKNKTVEFGASICESKNEFIENWMDWQGCSREEAERQYDNIPEEFGQLTCLESFPGMSFSDFQSLPNLVGAYPDGIKDEDGYVYTWIE